MCPSLCTCCKEMVFGRLKIKTISLVDINGLCLQFKCPNCSWVLTGALSSSSSPNDYEKGVYKHNNEEQHTLAVLCHQLESENFFLMF